MALDPSDGVQPSLNVAGGPRRLPALALRQARPAREQPGTGLGASLADPPQDFAVSWPVVSCLLPVPATPLHTSPTRHFVIGKKPAISPMTLTSSEPEGMTILAF